MKCTKCGQEFEGKFCTSCGAPNEAGNNPPPPPQYPPNQPPVPPAGYDPSRYQTSPYDKKPFYKKWWFWLIIGIAALILVAGAAASGDDDNSSSNSSGGSSVIGGSSDIDSSSDKDDSSAADSSTDKSNSSSKDTSSTTSSSKGLTVGDTFTFDSLEITIGSDIKFDTVKNQFSDHDGKTVAKVPVTIKNIKDTTHSLNMFYYSFFGPDGKELDSLSYYFDDDIISSGDLRSGATQNTYFHLLYTADGDYYIEFDEIFGKTIEVKVPIKK